MKELSRLGNYDTISALKEKYGPDHSIISIGPAELCSTIASVAVTDLNDNPSRHAGRGGLGAVIGSKGIKAIVIAKPSNKSSVQAADPEGFRETVRSFSKDLIESKKGLTKYGTASLVGVINSLKGLPTKNFSKGYNEDAENING